MPDIKRNISRIAGLIARLVFISSFVCPRLSLAGSDSAVINFSAVFVGGGCDISTSVSQIVFGGGETIRPADIISSPPQESFDVVLGNCTGGGLTPKITVSGESMLLNGQPLFRDAAASSSKGYGIQLSTAGNNSFNANTNLAQTKTISAKNWNTGTSLSELDTTLPVMAVLTCGNCDDSERQGGDLIASVTFDFVYD